MVTARKREVAGVVAALLLVAPPSGAGADELEDVRQQRQSAQEHLAQATEALEDTQNAIDEAKTEQARLQAEVAVLADAAHRTTEALVSRSLTAFRQRSVGGLDALLAAEGPVEAAQRARLLTGLERREAVLRERASAAQTALGQRRALLAGVVADLAADSERLDTEAKALAAALAAAAQREDALISRRARQRTVSRDRQQGVYACPMSSPYHFRDTWGAPRSGGRRHLGVDMFAAMGSPLYAITAGTISRHSNSGLGGLGLYLAGDDGNVYYYSHLQRIADGYTPGRRVEAGELVAYNGDSGNARGGAPHVHMEIRVSGASVNPYPYTAAACF